MHADDDVAALALVRKASAGAAENSDRDDGRKGGTVGLDSTLHLAHVALSAVQRPRFVGAGAGSAGGGGAGAAKSFISVTERLVGFLLSEGHHGRREDFSDLGVRADVQAALRTATATARRTDGQEERSNSARAADGLTDGSSNTGEESGGKHRLGLRSSVGSRRARRHGSKFAVSAGDKATLTSCSRRIGTHLQVATYRSGVIEERAAADATPPLPDVSNSASKSGERVRRKLPFARTVSGGIAGGRDGATAAGSGDLGVSNSANRAAGAGGPSGWTVNPILQPLTPLRERSLRHHRDGASVLCMWKGKRVVAKVIRGDFARFQSEADFFWSLAPSQNVQTMLGGIYEAGDSRRVEGRAAAKGSAGGAGTGKPGDANSAARSFASCGAGIGYIIFEHANGTSLDKAVRDNRLDDPAAQVRVLDKIVTALSFAAAVDPPSTHQELHPGNILLIPVEEPVAHGTSGVDEPVARAATGGGGGGSSLARTGGRFLSTPIAGGDEAELTRGSVITSTASAPDEARATRAALPPEALRSTWTTRPDGTLRISNHVVKVLDFGCAAEARAGGRVARGREKAVSMSRPDAMAGYIAPEKRVFRRRMINQTLLASDRNREGGERGKPTMERGPRRRLRSSSERDVDDLAGSEEDGALVHGDMLVPVRSEGQGREMDTVLDSSAGSRATSTGSLSRTRSLNQAGLNSGVDEGVTADMLAKVDVWSVGWLLYYMATGRHPECALPPSVAAFGNFDGDNDGEEQAKLAEAVDADLRHSSASVRDIVRMCLVYNPAHRAGLREVKGKITALLESMVFARGVFLLEQSTAAAMAMMDKAVAIRAPKSELYRDYRDRHVEADFNPAGLVCMREAGSPSPAGELHQAGRRKNSRTLAIGTNGCTHRGLAALPLVVVRRVEWEAMARSQHMTDADLAAVRGALVNHVWCKADVKDGPAAIKYLTRRDAETIGGNVAAKSALGWIYRWGAGNAEKDVPKALALWEAAVSAGDAEAANGLGLLYHHGRPGVETDGERARQHYQRAAESGYSAAAVNLGVMLHDGAAGVEMDGVGARTCYEMASAMGDGVAANNLGLLYQFGAPGVRVDGLAALRHYELAIVRGERNHARRNIGELLWDGAPGVPRDPEAAVQNFIIGLLEGDDIAKSAAKRKLKTLLESHDADVLSQGARSQARLALGDT
jgi:TPR repeat protein/serine/threonine protein kinase